ncbi:MAG: YHYH protein [bacterium]|nr:YHYH protein [bacterium]
MKGITASNQQFPTIHDHNITITRSPQESWLTKSTAPGAIGIAVNGVPIFSPDTQGPMQFLTGRPASALEKGELDECGGHAGRGDDYHYHVAPKCLIKDLGPTHVEVKKRPIGYAMDGYPILALGWFDRKNNIESLLDKCRGIYDSKKQYFYNVMHKPKWNILDCFKGIPQRNFNRDLWKHRQDRYSNEIIGSPIAFVVEKYQLKTKGDHKCHIMTGMLKNEQLLQTDMSIKHVGRKRGTLFYCNSGCYGQFFEADRNASFRGRVMYFERPTDNCPAVLGLAGLPMFKAYEGRRQLQHRGPPPGGVQRRRPPPAGPRNGRPPPPRPGDTWPSRPPPRRWP